VTAKGAASRRRKSVMADDTPLAQAILSGDNASILVALRGISQVTAQGCWIPRLDIRKPNGAKLIYNSKGYRQVYVGGRALSVHRVSLEAHRDQPLGRVAVHHVCAVRGCCNPDHLQPATAIQNNLEMMNRTAYLDRISDLECALRSLDPDHPLLWD